MNKKKQYLKIKKETPRKREAEQRVVDFYPTYHLFSKEEADTQSLRCIKCPVDLLKGLESEFSFCRTGCPLENKIPIWIEKVKEGDIKGAFEASNEISPFPEILGMVCPHDVLCQGGCTIAKTESGSVSIGAIEVYLNEQAFKMGLKPDYGQNRQKSGKRVAVIGSGPAGMSCATFLLRGGVEVDMFEKSDRPGGLLTYGIPNFKIKKDVILRRFNWMQEAGMNLHLNSDIQSSEQLKRMLDDYDAIFVGIGAPSSRGARMKNEDAHGVYHVMDILKHAQKRVFEDFYESILENKHVVVIGGGDSAMDAVRTSVRMKAKSVRCAYRRDEANMPGSVKEVINAKEEGVIFEFYTAPKEVIIDKGRHVKGLLCQRTQLGKPDESGRRKLEVIENSEFTLECDVIILALGFDNVEFPWYDDAQINTGKWGDIIVDDEKRTSNARIYAGGDAVRGADLAVTAAADGRKAALAMLKKFNINL
ncbi:FAD-dependent oxidoreductase [Sulfurovum sp. ST-21]|uniref:Glutamate synthase subunit beta n=1 Tax=Sulfurovum indicum TaxID=2779528 RepID=A0A7M1S133_9BACT|nr:glutamate synthase subunit beta [Sulfurovum indicum]QOR61157.1 glutamate synthase subunit beta [Sulfurovum indicum]